MYTGSWLHNQLESASGGEIICQGKVTWQGDDAARNDDKLQVASDVPSDHNSLTNFRDAWRIECTRKLVQPYTRGLQAKFYKPLHYSWIQF